MATAIQEVHVGDTGLDFAVTIMDGAGVIDLSGSSAVQFLFQKPDGTMLTVSATLPNGGGDGLASYITQTTDFDQDGTWSHQAFYAIGSTRMYSNITKFKVFPNLPLQS